MPAKRTQVLVCAGTGCTIGNSGELITEFEKEIKALGLENEIEVLRTGCLGLCGVGPNISIYPDNIIYKSVKVEDIKEIVMEHFYKGRPVHRLMLNESNEETREIHDINDTKFYNKQKRIALHNCGVIDPENINEYIGKDGYFALAKVLQEMTSQEVVDIIKESGLRGRGGGGFPTGVKWQFALDEPGDEKYVICNADEGDPGAFMDRSILEGNPLAVIEGMMIAGYAIGAKNGYFYVRAEYPVAVKRLRTAIQQAEEMGLLGDHILNTDFSFRVHIRLGAGAFVCGEETALLNSIEGKRGMPRPRPPFPAVKGLWDKPTIINNVETLATVPYILREGKDAFTQYGTEKSKGTKVFALGGKINNVGLVEIPMGTTLRELIYDIGGGIPNGKKFKAIQTGGPSGGCLTEKYLDTPIDFDNLVALGSMMGSGGAIVMDEDNCMVDVAKFYMEFICDESCGKCSPCRIGTKRMLEILTRITEGKGTLQDIDALEELGQAVKTGSLCGLGQTAANPIISTLTHFKDEYIAHVVDKKCPAKVCKKLMQYYIVPEKCKKCSLCARNCPVSCIKGEVGKTVYEIDQSRCIKCGMCQSSCRFNAIEKR